MRRLKQYAQELDVRPPGPGLGIVLGGHVVQLALSVVTSTLIARALGADAYGLVNLLRNGVLIALTISPLGLDVSLLKFLGYQGAGTPRMLAVVRRLRWLAFVIATGVWLLVAALASARLVGALYPVPLVDELAVVAFLALPFATDAAVLGAPYRAEGRVAAYALMTTYAPSAFRIVAIPLALWLAPSAAVVVTINTAQIMLSSALLWLDRRATAASRPEGGLRPDEAAGVSAEFRQVLGESGWMCLSGFVFSLMRSVDLMFLGIYVPARELGAYAALAMISSLIALFPMAASQTLGPRVSSAYASGAKLAVKRELDGYLALASPVSAFLFGGVVAFGPRLDLVFGSGFSFDPRLCFLLASGQVLSATFGPLGFALSMTGRHRAENAILSAGGLLLLLGCAVLVPRFGALGAAVTVTASFLFVNLVRLALVTRVIGAAPGRLKDFASTPVALAIALACAGASRLGPRDLPTTFLACVAYTLAFAAVSGVWFTPPAMARSLAARAFRTWRRRPSIGGGVVDQ